MLIFGICAVLTGLVMSIGAAVASRELHRIEIYAIAASIGVILSFVGGMAFWDELTKIETIKTYRSYNK